MNIILILPMLPKLLRITKFLLWVGVVVCSLLTIFMSFSFFVELQQALDKQSGVAVHDKGLITCTITFGVIAICFLISHYIFTLIVNSKYSLNKKIIRATVSFIFLLSVLTTLTMWGIIYASLTLIPAIGLIFMLILDFMLAIVILIGIITIITYSLCTKTGMTKEKAAKK